MEDTEAEKERGKSCYFTCLSCLRRWKACIYIIYKHKCISFHIDHFDFHTCQCGVLTTGHLYIFTNLLSFKALEMRKTPLFATRYYLHYLHSFTFIHIPSLQTSNIFCFFQSLHNFSLTQFSSCPSSIQFSSANSSNILCSTSLTSTSP